MPNPHLTRSPRCTVNRFLPLALISAAGIGLLAQPVLAVPAWISVWCEKMEAIPGTWGHKLQINKLSSEVDVKSIVRSKGIVYFRWRNYIASKDNQLCRTDARICDGGVTAVKCASRQELRNGKWVAITPGNSNIQFRKAVQFACDF